MQESNAVGSPTEEEVGAVLVASRVLVAVAAQSMASVEDGTDLLQVRALVAITTRGPLSLGGLAAAAGIHLTRASRLCDRLVARGLVSRSDDPTDRRQLLLRVTPAGQGVVDVVMQHRASAIRSILWRMDSEERRQLVQALTAFAAAGEGVTDHDLWTMGWPG